MLQSMTGYGKVNGSFNGKKIQIEIKALNGKNLDVYLKLPSAYREFELLFRQKIAQYLERGKIEIFVTIDNETKKSNNIINNTIFQSYFEEIKQLNTTIQQKEIDYFSTILKLPDVLLSNEEDINEEEKLFIEEKIVECCGFVSKYRLREGEELKKEFVSIIQRIQELLTQIEPFEKKRIEFLKQKFRKSVEEWSKNIQLDENRFEQELLYYIEKFDINEEKMRLSHHLNYFLESIDIPSSGKKLGFITQEIGREINTLGSKSYQSDMQKIVVEMKDDLEKMKEQILNTL
ncbi:MAG: YicC family protein [Flavobacteriia bacterium]|nr:YicC family protein [Flavobacteriia bacterium]